MNEILNIENLNKSFEGISLLKDVSFGVKKGSIVLISGENGSGKTTLFNLITGLEKPTKGKILFNGNNIANKSSLQIAQLGVISLYQQPRLFKNLEVFENLALATRDNNEDNLINFIFKSKDAKKGLHNQKSPEFYRIRPYDSHGLNAYQRLKNWDMEDLMSKRAGVLSYGQQKKVSFCMITMDVHQLVLLDEPFAGLNPQSIAFIQETIKYHSRSLGVTFLMIEHNINKALEIADSHIELKDGIIKTINSNVTA